MDSPPPDLSELEQLVSGTLHSMVVQPAARPHLGIPHSVDCTSSFNMKDNSENSVLTQDNKATPKFPASIGTQSQSSYSEAVSQSASSVWYSPHLLQHLLATQDSVDNTADASSQPLKEKCHKKTCTRITSLVSKSTLLEPNGLRDASNTCNSSSPSSSNTLSAISQFPRCSNYSFSSHEIYNPSSSHFIKHIQDINCWDNDATLITSSPFSLITNSSSPDGLTEMDKPILHSAEPDTNDCDNPIQPPIPHQAADESMLRVQAARAFQNMKAITSEQWAASWDLGRVLGKRKSIEGNIEDRSEPEEDLVEVPRISAENVPLSNDSSNPYINSVASEPSSDNKQGDDFNLLFDGESDSESETTVPCVSGTSFVDVATNELCPDINEGDNDKHDSLFDGDGSGENEVLTVDESDTRLAKAPETQSVVTSSPRTASSARAYFMGNKTNVKALKPKRKQTTTTIPSRSQLHDGFREVIPRSKQPTPSEAKSLSIPRKQIAHRASSDSINLEKCRRLAPSERQAAPTAKEPPRKRRRTEINELTLINWMNSINRLLYLAENRKESREDGINLEHILDEIHERMQEMPKAMVERSKLAVAIRKASHKSVYDTTHGLRVRVTARKILRHFKTLTSR